MRIFNVTFGKCSKILTEIQFKNFIETAVLHNRNVSSFEVTEIDSRLSEEKGYRIAQKLGFAGVYAIETQNGFATPYESIVNHLKVNVL